jgi:large subunit ribosomal protein L25
MEKIELEAKKRIEFGKKLGKLRDQGLIPAIVYGKKIQALSIAVDKKSFVKNILLSEAGMNAIVTLKIADEKGKGLAVLTHEVQRDPLTDDILHVDFRHILMDEAIKTRVPVELTGLPIGVKDDGGVLVHGLREVEVKCLPTDIPDKFVIDVSALKINDSLHVSDLTKVSKVEILTNPSEMVANCSPPTKEEVVAAPVPTPEEVAAAAAAAPELAEEEIKEKSAPGAPPPKEKPGKEAAPAPAAKPEKK